MEMNITRTRSILVAITTLVACFGCYFLGHRSGANQSLLKKDRAGLLVITLDAYQAAQTTNWAKVQNTLEIELLAFTRDYEQHYGIPTGTNTFSQRFAEAKVLADQIEQRLVPLADGLHQALGTNVDVKITK